MPPAVFIGSTQAVCVADRITFANLPARAQVGDHMVVVIAAANTVFNWAPVLGTWNQIIPHASAAASIFVLRKDIEATDGLTYSFDVSNAPISPWALGTLMIYRGLSPGFGIATGGATVAASTSYPCPSLTATTYSDLYLGMSVALSSATRTFTPPAGAVERLDYPVQFNALDYKILNVFDLHPEATGPTGTKTATCSASTNGIASGLLLATKPTPQPQSIRADAAGAIGFTQIGV